jgi:quercetin dioxygenase-like cupin family protein
MGPYRIDFTCQPWQTPLAGVRCKVQRLNGCQLRLVEYTREMPRHWCERGHTGFVLDGQLRIRFEGQDVIYNAGDGVFIPAGPEHRHEATVLTDMVRVIFVEDA